MLEIIGSSVEKSDTEIVLERKTVNKAVKEAICSIKNELPEEARTVEVMEYIVSELNDYIKRCMLLL